MQKWEYLFVSCRLHNNAWLPKWVNGQEVEDWQNSPPVHVYSNRLGQQGWELVSLVVSDAGKETQYRLTFKRPIP